MTQNYFLVLELPGGNEMRFKENGDSPKNFWPKAKNAIYSGTAKIICNRNDTGVSEVIRAYADEVKWFTTFLLLQMQLNPADFSESVLYNKAAAMLATLKSETIIDTTDSFQLVTIEA
ncbi:hypothetical protein ACLI09_16360 [Flavobacterium sp. RHBU_24]|uniref:hypothetical protein n=1 Tax=Flavobacterium sp. RHBU_24 TaxID=3391185 RepID=UPI00398500E8